jgi:hypothetical protein
VNKENDVARTLVTFGNATLRRDCIFGVVTIPGAYPGNPPRTRIITPGSFPVDVPETHDEALMRWRGSDADEVLRVHGLEKELSELKVKMQNIRNLCSGLSANGDQEQNVRVITAILAQMESP